MSNTCNAQHFSWLRLITRDICSSCPKLLVFLMDLERFSLLITGNI